MRTCIITGIGSGIGKATAIMLAERGYYDSYALIGRNDAEMRVTQEEMQKHLPEGSTKVYHIDLSNPEQIPEVVKAVDADMGGIDALLNIAGYTDPQPLLTTTLERECVKYMRQRGGKILNVASTAGMTPRPGWLSYASSKAAVISMSETLTAELSEYGIMVYCVSPGRCATKLRKRLAPDEDPTTIMQPAEVAEVICNLMNPEERCLDGQNIIIRKQMKKN